MATNIPSNEVVVADRVSKTYGRGNAATTALSDVSLSVADQEFLALLGPSGSGKTTLLSILGGLLTPSEGTVTITGKMITDLSAKQRAQFRADHIGFVFQSFNLVPFLTARENLIVATQFSKKTNKAQVRERADQLLSELDIQKRSKNLPEELSGGERQRVAIGRALINDPDVILVDEPTANLDTKLGRAVVELIASEISERKKAGIMVTHDPRMVEYTDRTVEILDGTATVLAKSNSTSNKSEQITNPGM